MPQSYVAGEPSPAGRRLAAELRRIRERTGMSGDAVAKRLKWSPSKVSRLERAQTCINPGDAGKLLLLYRVPEDQAQVLTALAGRAWAERYLEENARFAVEEVLAWAPLAVPLLLRTEDYYAAVLGNIRRVTPISPGMIRADINRNILWQARLLADNPIKVRVVLDESVLLRNPGDDRSVMRDQVAYLVELSGQDHIDLRVLPLSGSGPSHLPPFTYTRFGEDDLPVSDEVEVATLTEPWSAGSERDIWLHYLAFEQLAKAADPAADYLERALRGWS